MTSTGSNCSTVLTNTTWRPVAVRGAGGSRRPARLRSRFSEDLADAAMSAPAALEKLMATRWRSSRKGPATAARPFSTLRSDRTFGEIAAVGGGGTPSTTVPEYWDGAVSWATPTDITALRGPYLSATARTITNKGLANCASALYPVGSILMTSRATIGAFALAKAPTAVNQGFIVVTPKNDDTYWLFHEMRSRIDEFVAHANGATFLELSRGNFKRLRVRLAGDNATKDFEARVGPLHNSASTALDENRTLAATRDALLQALMSGRLRVADLDSADSAAESVL